MSAAACVFCGVSADLDAVVPTGRLMTRMDLDTIVCGECATLEPDRPGGALRAAARVLGAAEEDPYLHDALREDNGALDGLLYADPGDPLRLRARTPQHEPWQHVPRETRAALARALERSLELRSRAKHDDAAGDTAPPSGPAGCLLCGVGRSLSWRRVLTSALTRGPGMIEGHLCATCAIQHDAVGAFGQPLVESAVTEAKGLAWWEAARIPGLQAWVATGRPPGEPWAWVELVPSAPDLDDVTALRIAVRDLTDRVADLEARLVT